MNKQEQFLKVFKQAERKYSVSQTRLAGEGWQHDWQTLITTIMSAQSRDETTIPIAESLFKKYPSLNSLANAHYQDVLTILKSLNYNRTKAKHVIGAAGYMITHFNGQVPDTIEQLIQIPGVGRKTANLVLTECHKKEGICVDTHVHRIANVLGWVNTKTPTQTEFALQKLAPQSYWSRINRTLVLWGKDVPGKDKERLLAKIKEQ